MESPDLFDFSASISAKREGMDLAADNREADLALARRVAVGIAMASPDRTCHADQVGRALKRDYGIASLGPAAGSIFKGAQWQFTGERVLSVRATNHARELKVWRLIDGNGAG